MAENDNYVSSLDDANAIIREQDRLLGQYVRENAALKVKADMYDDLFSIVKLLNEKYPTAKLNQQA